MLTGVFDGTGQSQTFTVLNKCYPALVMSGTNVVDLEWLNAGSWVVLKRYSASDQGLVDIGQVARCRLNCTTHDTADIIWTISGNILADDYTSIEGLYSLLDEAGEDLFAEDSTYLLSEEAA